MPHEPDCDKVIELLPAFIMMTVKETERETRGGGSGKHHPEQVVLLTDCYLS